jgi:hypothetical protein
MVDGAVMLRAATADQRQYPGCRAPCTMFLLTVCVLCVHRYW